VCPAKSVAIAQYHSEIRNVKCCCGSIELSPRLFANTRSNYCVLADDSAEGGPERHTS